MATGFADYAKMKLREFTIEDAGRVAELVGDYEVSKWTSSIPYPYGKDDAIAWIESAASGTLRHPYAVEIGDELAACVSYWINGTGDIEVGYWVGRSYWGNGIATRALQSLLDSSSFPNCERVVAKVMEGNRRSERVLERCGFKSVDFCSFDCQGVTIPSNVFIRAVQ